MTKKQRLQHWDFPWVLVGNYLHITLLYNSQDTSFARFGHNPWKVVRYNSLPTFINHRSNYYHTSRKYLPVICRFFTKLSVFELSKEPWDAKKSSLLV